MEGSRSSDKKICTTGMMANEPIVIRRDPVPRSVRNDPGSSTYNTSDLPAYPHRRGFQTAGLLTVETFDDVVKVFFQLRGYVFWRCPLTPALIGKWDGYPLARLGVKNGVLEGDIAYKLQKIVDRWHSLA